MAIKRRTKSRRHTISQTMLTPKQKIGGMYWVFHKGDNDDHPSVPHGHSIDGKYKLELWNGNIFNIQTGKIKFKAKKKDMTALYNLPGFLEFVNECREAYRERNPAIVLPTLTYKQYKSKARYRRATPLPETFTVFIRHNRI